MKKFPISLGEIQSAKKRITPWIHKSDLKLFHTLSEKVYNFRSGANYSIQGSGINNLQNKSFSKLEDPFKSSDMRIGYVVSTFKKISQKFKHAFCTRIACKAELALRYFFKRGNSQALQSSDNRARNRGALTPPWGVYLKMENDQVTGSFKIRGALNKVLSLSESERRRVLISCSAGNHAQGVAYAARIVGASALIVVPRHTPKVKKEAVRFYGAEVVECGEVYDESYEYARRLCEEKSGIFIHPYLDPLVVTGQGSVGLEILEALPDVDSVIVPIGGGGLIGGVTCAIKQIRPECRIYGVVSNVSPAMEHLFHGRSYDSEQDFSGPGLADGISVKQPSLDMLKTYLLPYVEDVVSVTEQEIASAVMFLLERGKTLVEGAGAVSVAGLLKAPGDWKLGKKCVVILSGGNIDLNNISQLIQKFL